MIKHPNAKLWLPFTEGVGTTTADLSGSNLTGTLTAGTTWADGLSGKAITVDATHQSSGAATGVTAINGFTWITRCKPTSFPSSGLGGLISETNAYQNIAFGNGTYGWRFVSYYNSVSNNTVENFSPQTLDTWYTVAAVRDNVGMKMHLYVWVDGSYYHAETALSSSAAYWSGSTFAVGRLSATYAFIGLVDNFVVYNKPLTLAEILRQISVNKPPLFKS